MIVTVTPNPSLDRTYFVDAVRVGELHRAQRATVEASGKGVNVSRILAALGVPTVAVLPVGGDEGRQLAGLLAAAGLEHRAVPAAGAARVNTNVVEPGGHTTKFNEVGRPLSDGEQDALVGEVREAARRGAAWVACCGSLPPGADPGLVARFVEAAHEAGARIAVDTSGAALPAALAAGADLITPNRDELAELVGRPLPGVPEVAAAAAEAAAPGTAVLATLGGDGAVYVGGGERLWARAPAVEPVNTTGAGDALLAGYLAAATRGGDQGDQRTWLAEAVAVGTSACLAAGTAELPDRPVPASRVSIRPLPAATSQENR
jgi:1-phosphofructokinase